jgi:hypothetical protein
MFLREVKVNGRLLQIAMSKQDLNGPKIGAGFEQVRGEAVPAMPRPGLCRVLVRSPPFMGI